MSVRAGGGGGGGSSGGGGGGGSSSGGGGAAILLCGGASRAKTQRRGGGHGGSSSARRLSGGGARSAAAAATRRSTRRNILGGRGSTDRDRYRSRALSSRARNLCPPPPPPRASSRRPRSSRLQRNRELAIRVYALRNECPVSAILAQFCAILRNFADASPSSSARRRGEPVLDEGGAAAGLAHALVGGVRLAARRRHAVHGRGEADAERRLLYLVSALGLKTSLDDGCYPPVLGAPPVASSYPPRSPHATNGTSSRPASAVAALPAAAASAAASKPGGGARPRPTTKASTDRAARLRRRRRPRGRRP